MKKMVCVVVCKVSGNILVDKLQQNAVVTMFSICATICSKIFFHIFKEAYLIYELSHKQHSTVGG